MNTGPRQDGMLNNNFMFGFGLVNINNNRGFCFTLVMILLFINLPKIIELFISILFGVMPVLFAFAHNDKIWLTSQMDVLFNKTDTVLEIAI